MHGSLSVIRVEDLMFFDSAGHQAVRAPPSRAVVATSNRVGGAAPAYVVAKSAGAQIRFLRPRIERQGSAPIIPHLTLR